MILYILIYLNYFIIDQYLFKFIFKLLNKLLLPIHGITNKQIKQKK